MDPAPTRQDPALVELRRRLYREGAGPDDLARYRAALGAVHEPAPAPAAPPPLRRPRWIPVLAAVAVAVTIGVGAALVVPAPETGRAVHSPAPQHPADGVLDVWSAAQPAQLIGTIGPDAQQYTGVGPGTIPLDPRTAMAPGGRMRITMTTRDTARIGWQVTRTDRPSAREVLAQRLAVQVRGVPIPVEFGYAGRAPSSVRVSAPAHLRWWIGLEFAASPPRAQPPPHPGGAGSGFARSVVE